MLVSEAVANRRSIREFLSTPVDRAVLERVLDRARFAPSGGNVQPWQAVIVTGEPLIALVRELDARKKAGDVAGDFDSYPAAMPEPWMGRRRECAADLYDTLNIERGDKEARARQAARNWTGFGAPCILFCHMPRFMQPAQWADLGIWLQTVMLLFQEEGVATCAQGAWAHVGGTVRDLLGIPKDHVLYCGLAIGYADLTAPVNSLRTSRAPVDHQIRFIGS